GFSNGLTAPNPKAQLAVLRAALTDARVEALAIDYVETHGPGTILGDPMEAGALGAVLGARRPGAQLGERTLRIGSIKTNLGHLEAAAGVAGLIKTALALHHRAIPPNLHFERPNPHIDFVGEGLAVQTNLEPWPEVEGRPPRAGVSSFGFGGTNCHLILEAAPDSRARLLAIEAEDVADLRAQALACFGAATARGLARGIADLRLSRRQQPAKRLRTAAMVRTREAVLAELTTLLSTPEQRAVAVAPRRPRLIFVCPGHGSQWPGMLRGLLREPVVRQTLEQCQRILASRCSWSLLEALSADDGRRLEELEVTQLTLCVGAIAIGRLWRAWGVEPDAIVGHSIGEIAAAQLAGALSLEDAMTIALARSRAIAEHAAELGGMLVVHRPQAETVALLGPLMEKLTVAVDGAPAATVLSGTHVSLAAAEVILEPLGIRHARVDIQYPSHGPAMAPALQPLREALADLRPRRATTPLRSTVRDGWLRGPECDAEHWVLNLREPVRLAGAIRAVTEDEPSVFIELGGHPVVLGPIRELLAERDTARWTLASGRRNEDARECMLTGLATLYTLGIDPRWEVIDTVFGVVAPEAEAEVAAVATPVPLLISGKSEAGLRAQAEKLHEALQREQDWRLVDVGYSLATTRACFERRALIFASTRFEAIAGLAAIAGLEGSAGAGQRVEGLADIEGAMAWLFPARLELTPARAAALLAREPAVAASLERSDARLGAAAGSLRAQLLGAGDPALAEAAEIAGM
ncbi:MAG: type I polyketide synthase, partial [Myxococcales bacterium]|nr:type I polyketide synthase [Myxococcales bacterium]